jgi:uncharacterized protein
MSRAFLTADWRYLAMLNYAVDPAALQPYVPAGTELDSHRGITYASVVGFQFLSTRVFGIAFPFHRNFEEVNLRFYVRRTEPDGTRKRGVVFMREFVPRAAITLLANALYEEPYTTLPTRYSLTTTPQSLDVQYSWKHRGTWQSLAVAASPTPQPIAAGSEEEFLTEHYWGYTKRRDGSTSEYEVRHPRWQIYPIQQATIVANFAELYGPNFAALNTQQPSSVLLAEGSAVSVHSGTRLSA